MARDFNVDQICLQTCLLPKSLSPVSFERYTWKYILWEYGSGLGWAGEEGYIQCAYVHISSFSIAKPAIKAACLLKLKRIGFINFIKGGFPLGGEGGREGVYYIRLTTKTANYAAYLEKVSFVNLSKVDHHIYLGRRDIIIIIALRLLLQCKWKG